MALSTGKGPTIMGLFIWLGGLNLTLDMVVLAFLVGPISVGAILLGLLATGASVFGAWTFWRAPRSLSRP